MENRNVKLLLAALVVALFVPEDLWLGHGLRFGPAFADDPRQERGTEQRSERERDYWMDAFGPAVALENGEDLEARLDHIQRYEELDGIFSEALAREAGLESPGLWELHPDIHFFRTVLTQTALNGEAACDDRRKCAALEASGLAPTTTIEVAACSWTQSCERQHIETMSSCAEILNSRCRSVAEVFCRRMRRQAYDLCVDVASCQLDCCLGYCSGTNCATWAANDKTGVKCTDCTPPTLPPG